jgi:hypothetical protein
MTGIWVGVIAFGLGCLSGLLYRVWTRRRRANDLPRASQSRGLPSDQRGPRASSGLPLTPRG